MYAMTKKHKSNEKSKQFLQSLRKYLWKCGMAKRMDFLYTYLQIETAWLLKK